MVSVSERGFCLWFASSGFFHLRMCLVPQRPFNLNVNMPAYTGPAVLQPGFILSLLKCVKIWYASGNIFHSSLHHLHMTAGWQTDDWQSYRPPEVDWRHWRSEAWPQIVEVEETSVYEYSNDPFLYHLSFYARIWPHTSFIGYLSWLPRLKPAKANRQTHGPTDGRMQEFIKN